MEAQAAANAFRVLAKQFETMTRLGEFIQELGDLENRRNELERATEAARADAEEADVERMVSEEALKLADLKVVEAMTRAERIGPDALAEATRVRHAADEYAAAVRKQAEVDQRNQRDALALERHEHAQVVARLTGEVEALEVSRDTIAAEIEALRKRIGG